MFPLALPIYLAWSLLIVAFERSSRYGEVIAFTFVAVFLRTYMLVLPGLKGMRLVEQWAGGRAVDSRGAFG
jgi:hypothetical protein